MGSIMMVLSSSWVISATMPATIFSKADKAKGSSFSKRTDMCNTVTEFEMFSPLSCSNIMKVAKANSSAGSLA